MDVTNGVAPLTYSWTGPGGFTADTEDLINLSAAGTYNLTITDANNCTATTSAEIEVPELLTITLDGDFDPTCNAANDGSIEATVGGGTSPYDVVLKKKVLADIITVETKEDVPAGKQVFSNLGGGIYLVEVTDSNGCTAVKDLIQIDEPLEVTGIPTPGPESCAGADGVINLVPSGGNGFYSYLWEKLDDVNFTSTDQNLSGLAAGTYKCTITDTNGCIGVVDGIVVDAPFDCNQLFPTQTECSDYLYCDTDKIVQDYMCVTIKKNKGVDTFTNVIPGALFYYGDFIAPQINVDNSVPMVIQLEQTRPNGFPFMRYVNDDNVRIYQNGCEDTQITDVRTFEQNGKYYVEAVFTPQSSGQHVFSVKLDPKSVKGPVEPGFVRMDNDPYFNSYLMGMVVDGTTLGVSYGSLGMNTDRRCSDPVVFERVCEYPSAATLADETTALKSSISLEEEPSFSVAPVPFTDQLTVRYEFEYTSDVKIQFFDLNGSLLRTYADKQVTSGDETQINIDFALKANQVYIIRVETDRDSFSKQVMSGN